ncbi:uncharacterized protein N0V89_005067 [Didymosphaeria variabile]|uniref:LRAT domain-containing protein n=1 Tax=Didymosphaeria variabile TaxID=1932322 RepID=A0A9W8XKW6_9PLEO|nr:uncharacterized protein N0V89_005067 [Didymosphaeria variabile]KAJ4353339.1 hypothetical protein N0V89_005067 [Didymosphaeria variabile]
MGQGEDAASAEQYDEQQNEAEPRKRTRCNPPTYHPGKDMEIALLIVVWSRGLDVAPEDNRVYIAPEDHLFSTKKISHWAIQIGDTVYEYGLHDHELKIVPADKWHHEGKHDHEKRQLEITIRDGGHHPTHPRNRRGGSHPITVLRDWTHLSAHRIDLYARKIYQQQFKGKYNFCTRNCQIFVRCLLFRIWKTEACMAATIRLRSGNVVEKGRGAEAIEGRSSKQVFDLVQTAAFTDGIKQVDELPVWHKKVAWAPLCWWEGEVKVPTFGQATAGGGIRAEGSTRTVSTLQSPWFGGSRPREWICYYCKDGKDFQTEDICAICGHSYWW